MADRRLQVFYTVAKQLSFTKAADILYMTQPAVTFQVKQLEEHFNTRLFERSHGKISLTLAGDLVLGYAERILALTAEMDATGGRVDRPGDRAPDDRGIDDHRRISVAAHSG